MFKMKNLNKEVQRPYRHEIKYMIDDLQVEILKSRLSQVIDLDPHTGNSGQYHIRSIYFDDYQNNCYYDVENGYNPREKFRVRIYNCSDRRIRLELKRKESGKTFKRACLLSLEQTERLLSGSNVIWKDDMDPLLKKFYLWMEMRAARPVVVVAYDRIPFVHPDGNVRITLDTNISSSADIEGFFRHDLPLRPIMPLDRQLLEVKYDEFLPDFIYRTIPVNELKQTNYSKYYLCRKFGGIR